MIVGAPWNLDWRNENADSAGYADWVAFGEDVAFVTLESPSNWKTYHGLVVSDPVVKGYYDDIQRETLGEAYMGSVLPWPLHGQQGPIPDVALIELAEEAGFDIGGHLAQAITPRMVFASPPSYSEQTDPIPAIGYP